MTLVISGKGSFDWPLNVPFCARGVHGPPGHRFSMALTGTGSALGTKSLRTIEGYVSAKLLAENTFYRCRNCDRL